jgi:hypothetical protein
MGILGRYGKKGDEMKDGSRDGMRDGISVREG